MLSVFPLCDTTEHPAVQEKIPSDSGGSEVESGTVAHDPIISSVDVDDDDDGDGVFQWTGSPLSRPVSYTHLTLPTILLV